jgi:hypothetical protein
MRKNHNIAITDAVGEEVHQGLPEITDVNPVGNQILVEIITPDELMGPSKLHIPDSAKGGATVSGAPQAYVLKVGPSVDPNWGVQAGNRIVLSGTFTPLPEAVSKNSRPRACVEPHTIKAVLVE